MRKDAHTRPLRLPVLPLPERMEAAEPRGSSRFGRRYTRLLTLLALLLLAPGAGALAQESPPAAPADFPSGTIQNTSRAPASPIGGSPSSPGQISPQSLLTSSGLPDLSKKETLSSAMQIMLLLTVLSLAPAILLMMTSFTRIIIVLSLLRQALGTQQLPPNQVIVGLSLFMTFLVMGPTFTRVNDEAIHPYMDGKIDQQLAWKRAQQPARDFMIKQIDRRGNYEDVYMFCDFAHENPSKWSDVGTSTLVPAFMLSELKTAFLLGFNVYLPFLIIDMVISAVLISMGMMMLPPVLISLPFKLLLFVLVDGWHLITRSLLGSFVA